MTLEGKLYIEYWGGPHAAIEQLHRRVAELEKRTCDGSSVMAPQPSSYSPSPSSSSPSSPAQSGGVSTTSDRPAWITDAMLPLPVGTERVYRLPEGKYAAFPGGHWGGDGEWPWSVPGVAHDELWWKHQRGVRVWHVPQVEAVTDHATKGSAWERFADRYGYRKDMVSEAVLLGKMWIDGEQFNDFVAAEVARAGKPRRPAREVAEEAWRIVADCYGAYPTDHYDSAIVKLAAAIERDREEGAR